MPRPFSQNDYEVSIFFDIISVAENIILDRTHLFSFIELTTTLNINLPDEDTLSRNLWPIGGYGIIYANSTSTLTLNPSPNVTINNSSSAIAASFTAYTGSLTLYRNNANSWRAIAQGVSFL